MLGTFWHQGYRIAVLGAADGGDKAPAAPWGPAGTERGGTAHPSGDGPERGVLCRQLCPHWLPGMPGGAGERGLWQSSNHTLGCRVLRRGAHGKALSWCWAWGAEESPVPAVLSSHSLQAVREVFLSCVSMYLLVMLSHQFQVFSCMC